MNVDSCESDCPGAMHEFTNPVNVKFPAPQKQCGGWAKACGRIQRKGSLFPGRGQRLFENDHICTVERERDRGEDMDIQPSLRELPLLPQALSLRPGTHRGGPAGGPCAPKNYLRETARASWASIRAGLRAVAVVKCWAAASPGAPCLFLHYSSSLALGKMQRCQV